MSVLSGPAAAFGTEPLKPSGFGGVLTFDDPPDPRAIRDTATTRGVAVVRDLDLDEDSFRALAAGMGTTIVYEGDNAGIGYGYRDLLTLDGSTDKKKVVTGRGPLSLHNDGALVASVTEATHTDLIVLYAAEADCPRGDGATFACDLMTAWRELPPDLRRVLDVGFLEYFIVERGFYPTLPEGWFPVPTKRNTGRVRSLNLAMPFPDERASWLVRVPGADSEESQRFFTELEAFFMDDAYLYTHHWRPGDLLVIDNQRTLHGRTALEDGSVRRLLRAQLTLGK